MSPELLKKLKSVQVNAGPGAKIGKSALIAFEPKVSFACTLNLRGQIGAFTYIRGGRIGSNVKSIGRYCSIAPNISVGDGNHPMTWLSTAPFQYGGTSARRWLDNPDRFPTWEPDKTFGVTIGNDVWIGSDVLILPGIKIADGAVIAGGSVVTKDVEPYMIVAGNPARPMRTRLPAQDIERVLKLQWWQYDANDLEQVPFDDPVAAMDEIERRAALGLIAPAQYKVTMIRGE
jgi:acetyltransferase-like isoleucine patch superfamily enzyme